MSISKMPVAVPVLSNGLMSQEWTRFFASIVKAGGSDSTGPSVVKNAGTVQLTMSEGPTASMPSAVPGGIHLSTDEHVFYVVQGGVWRKFDEPLVGDVLKDSGSNLTTLQTVNQAPGSYGSESEVPVITVDQKGRVTSVTLKTVVAKQIAKGGIGAIQFNSNWEVAGTTTIRYDTSTNAFVFDNPEATLKNLSPLRNYGEILWFNGSEHAALPLGSAGSGLRSGFSGLEWVQDTWGWSYGMIPQTLNFSGTCTRIEVFTNVAPDSPVTLTFGTGEVYEVSGQDAFSCVGTWTSPITVSVTAGYASRGSGWIKLTLNTRIGTQV